MKTPLIVKWWKKEQDWAAFYQNRNSRILGRVFCQMISDFEERMKIDWQGNPTDFKDFRQYLINAGFDPDSLRITIKELPKKDNNGK